ncbi:MAG: hypothetical protein F7C81_00545 [Desulfurococcales archaeon]|nr:hypothetical protein [Desulfurococcales archaeon]
MSSSVALRLVSGGPYGKTVYPSIDPGTDYSIASNTSTIYSIAALLGRHLGKNVRKIVIEYDDNSIIVIWKASDGSIAGVIAEPGASIHRRRGALLHQQ